MNESRLSRHKNEKNKKELPMTKRRKARRNEKILKAGCFVRRNVPADAKIGEIFQIRLQFPPAAKKENNEK
jgi:hypothetical protein